MNLDAFTNPAIVNMLNIGTKVTVVRITMVETGTYNPMYSRNYSLNSNVTVLSDLINNLSERVSNAGLAVTPELVSGLSSGLIRQTPDAGNMLSIPNGWDRPRFRYSMTVNLLLPNGLTETYEIQGYSEYLDQSLTGKIDPNMRMYINSMTRVAEYTNQHGQRMFTTAGSSQILNGAIAASHDSTGVFSMRPRDVVGEIQWQYMSEDTGNNFKDGRANITGRSTGSNRSNAVPSTYLAETLKNWIQTTTENELHDDRAIVSGTLNRLQENFYEENKFISELVKIQGFGNGGFFTMNSLEKLDSNFTVAGALLSNVMNVIFLGHDGRRAEVTIGQGSDWGGRDLEAVWAASISQSFPAIINKYGIGNYAVAITNKTLNGECHVETTNMQTKDITKYNPIILSAVNTDISNLIMKDLSLNNLIKYIVNISCDTYGTTSIELRLEDRPVQHFFMPSFADSIPTPLITNTKNELVTFAQGIEHVMRTVTGNVLDTNTDNIPVMSIDI